MIDRRTAGVPSARPFVVQTTINPWRTIMHARIDNPALTVPGALTGAAGDRRTRSSRPTSPRRRCISSSCARARSTAAASASTSTPASSSMRASPTSASTRSPPGGMSRTSPRPSGPRWRSPRRPRVSPTARTPSRTTCGTRPRATTTSAQLAALVLAIAAINTWNRLNVTTRQISGDWVGQWVDASAEGEGGSLTRSGRKLRVGERRRRAPLANPNRRVAKR